MAKSRESDKIHKSKNNEMETIKHKQWNSNGSISKRKFNRAIIYYPEGETICPLRVGSTSST